LVKFFEDIRDAYADVADQLEAINATTEHYINVIDIVGKRTLGVSNTMMRSLKSMQTSGAQANLANAKNEYDELLEAKAKVEADLNNALATGGSEAAAVFEERLKEIDKLIAESAQNVRDTFEAALTSVVEEY
jgi:hypothetical protein